MFLSQKEDDRYTRHLFVLPDLLSAIVCSAMGHGPITSTLSCILVRSFIILARKVVASGEDEREGGACG